MTQAFDPNAIGSVIPIWAGGAGGGGGGITTAQNVGGLAGRVFRDITAGTTLNLRTIGSSGTAANVLDVATVGSGITLTLNYQYVGGTSTYYGDGAAGSAAANNTAFGKSAGARLTGAGAANTAVGSGAIAAGAAAITGDNNTALGRNAGNVLTGAAAGNTLLGALAGDSVTSGLRNVAIGYNADVPSATGNDQLSLGNSLWGDLANHYYRIGSSGAVSSVTLDLHVASPTFQLFNTSGGANEKAWRLTATGTTLSLATLTDALGAGSAALTITRSGTNITSVNVPNGVLQEGGVDVFTFNDNVELLPTAELNTSKALIPDGLGGLTWGTPGVTVTLQDAYDAGGTADIDVPYLTANPWRLRAADNTSDVLMRFVRPTSMPLTHAQETLFKAPDQLADTAVNGGTMVLYGSLGSSYAGAGNATAGGDIVLRPGAGGSPTNGNGGDGGNVYLGGGFGNGQTGVGANKSGGVGGFVSVDPGIGGSATGSGNPGAGGYFNVNAGYAGGVYTGTAQVGGYIGLTAGKGSPAYGNPSSNAGDGGYLSLYSGLGGNVQDSNSTPGNGGVLYLWTGNGGDSQQAGTGGTGGLWWALGGTGGASTFGAGGVGGEINLYAGDGGAGATAGGNGGDVRIDAGAPGAGGTGVAGKIYLAATNATEILSDAPFNFQANYVQFADIAAPANAGAAKGRLYKLTGDDGLWWKPDGAGVAVDLTEGITDGDKGDITVSGGGTTWTIDNGVVTFAKMANMSPTTIIGRYSVGAGAPEAITVGTSLEVTVGGTLQRSALTGDVTATAGSNATTIANNAVTFAKFQNISTDRLLGRDTAGSGNVEEISLNATLEFTGAGAIQRAALTGDVTATAGSNATTIANSAVTDAKLRDSGALSVIGRSANSVGAPADIATTASSDAVLRESGGVLGFGTIATAGIANSAVTLAKMADVTGPTLLGRTSGTGAPQALSGTNATTILDVFTGATAMAGGVKGLVPAPSAGDQAKVLRGDGTWVTPASSTTSLIQYTFDTGTGTGPASGELRINNATYSAATAIYVSDTDANSVSVQTLLDFWASLDRIIIRSVTSATKWVVYRVTGANTDAGTYHNITVTYVADSGSSFSDGDSIILENANGSYEFVGANVASAGTIDLNAATGDVVDITGTTNITAITLAAGRERTIRFQDTLTVTNGASLILPGAYDIQTQAGDMMIVRGYASGVVRVVSYTIQPSMIVTAGRMVAMQTGAAMR
jgi:hypothetical protein